MPTLEVPLPTFFFSLLLLAGSCYSCFFLVARSLLVFASVRLLKFSLSLGPDFAKLNFSSFISHVIIPRERLTARIYFSDCVVSPLVLASLRPSPWPIGLSSFISLRLLYSIRVPRLILSRLKTGPRRRRLITVERLILSFFLSLAKLRLYTLRDAFKQPESKLEIHSRG